MLTQCSSLPRSFQVERFVTDYTESAEQAALVDRIHEADGQNFAAEFAHGPAICTEPDCREIPCIAYHRAITNAAIVAAYPHGFCGT